MKYSIILAFILLSNLSFSQELGQMIDSRKFVIEANTITDIDGNTNSASRKLCFIRVDADNIIVQWTANCDNNGLGGITLGGEIENYEYSSSDNDKDQKHTVNIKCKMDDGRVKSNIVLEIFDKSHAEATFNNTTSSIFIPEKITFKGKMESLESSRIVIGAN